jgi:hypothetical protein
MIPLLAEVLDAHGSVEKWCRFNRMSSGRQHIAQPARAVPDQH